MRRRLVLDDFQPSDACALLAPGAQKQASIGSRPEQDGTCCRQVGLGIEVFGDANRVLEDGRIDVIVSIDVNTPHELDEMPCLRPAMASGLVQGFTDEMEWHRNFPVLQVRLSYHVRVLASRPMSPS